MYTRRSERVARLLIAYRANIEAQSSTWHPLRARHHETPLQLAASLGRDTLVQILLEAGAELGGRTAEGHSAIDNAAGRGCGWTPGCRSEQGARRAYALLKWAAGPIEEGKRVRIVNLTERRDLNGSYGIATQFCEETDRWRIHLGEEGGQWVRVRTRNLELGSQGGSDQRKQRGTRQWGQD